MSAEFRVDIIGHRAEIVLNAPQKLNMLSFEWAQELGAIVDRLDADPNVLPFSPSPDPLPLSPLLPMISLSLRSNESGSLSLLSFLCFFERQ